jgi:hypothetical protein
MDKGNVVHTQNGIIFSQKKELNPATCNNMGVTKRYYVK